MEGGTALGTKEGQKRTISGKHHFISIHFNETVLKMLKTTLTLKGQDLSQAGFKYLGRY